MHPGAFSAGSGYIDGEYLASKGVVFVSINYRLGALGFMAHKALREDNPKNISGNYGLLDQIFALNWVKRNILMFGGDPNKVTIGGQSAGAVSAYILALSPLASNLFKGVIVESGGAMHPRDPQNMYIWHYTVDEAEKRSADFLSTKNINNQITASQLRAIPLDKIVENKMILDNQNQRATWLGGPVLFHPVLDKYVIARTYEETLQKGLQNDVDIIIGK
uniref:Carboxylic ester hydrolase n=1 Tax=Meloidogyne hapla TaxID=6305 RepID=A0A1I8BKM1_MELHA